MGLTTKQKQIRLARIEVLIQDGYTALEIAKDLYRGQSHIPSRVNDIYMTTARYLPHLEKQLRSLSATTRHQKQAASLRTRSYNEKFFDTWSHAMAWVLGFFYADGCLYYKNNKPTFEVGCADKDVIENIQRLLQTDYQITKKITIREGRRYKDIYQLGIYDCLPYERALTKLGVGARKSLDLQFPLVPPQYFMDFVRGIIDGDGSISGKSISFYCGSRDFLEVLARDLNRRLNKSMGVRYSNQAYGLSYTGQAALRLGQLLYETSTSETRMLRKYKKWKELQCLLK